MSAAHVRGVALVVALACACADTVPLEPGVARDGGAGVAAPDSGLDPRDLAWVRPLAEATCARELRCAPVDLIRAHGEEQDCIDDLVERWAPEAEQRAAAVGAGRAERIEGALESCLGALAEAPCTGGDTAEVCTLFRGRVAPGSGCRIDAECRGGYCEDGGDRCGQCRAYGRSCCERPGFGCFDHDPCAPGQLCSFDTCVVARGEGEPCGTEDGACRAGLVCWGQPLVCQALGREGEACIGTGAGFDTCDRGRGLSCVAERCVQGRVAPTGDVCGGPSVAICTPGSYCDESGLTCEPVRAVGELCTDRSRCARGSRCDVNTGVCRALLGPGEPCVEWLCRPGLECVGGACAELTWEACP